MYKYNLKSIEIYEFLITIWLKINILAFLKLNFEFTLTIRLFKKLIIETAYRLVQ